jgi:WD40 repeat protein
MSMLTVTGKHQLKDGFQELFIFRGHRLQLRGFNTVEWLEDNIRQTAAANSSSASEYRLRYHYYISWDVKQVLLWKHDILSWNSKPQLLHSVKFSNQPNFVCAIVHITKMKVFLAAALDMSFKIFDRQLNLLESIHHEERAILQLEYDQSKDLIFSSGANGISVWKLYRNLTLDKSHVMEKLYSFLGCENWITKMIYEPEFDRIYALKERSAQVLSLTRQNVITTLENVHDAPVSAICWYERNQFYLTGCSRGEIKCWTSNFTSQKHPSSSSSPDLSGTYDLNGTNNNANNKSNIIYEDYQYDPSAFLSSSLSGNNPAATSTKKFALLHVFKGHTKAVTAIKLHPVSGLAISTSLDGFVKILNLEALNELFTFQCDTGILNMRLLRLSTSFHACLLALDDASIRLWKITSVCDYFSVTTAKIDTFSLFDNYEGENDYYYRLNRKNERSSASTDQKIKMLMNQFGEYHMGGLFSNNANRRTVVTRKSMITGNTGKTITHITDPTSSTATGVNIKTVSIVDRLPSEDDPATKDEAEGEEEENNEAKSIEDIKADKIIITASSQDVRAFNQKGNLLGRLEPEDVVESIKAYTVNVYSKLLICLCEGDKVKVHDLKRFHFPLLFEISLKGSLGGNGPSSEEKAGSGSILDDLATAIALIDVIPSAAVRAPRTNAPNYNHQNEHQQRRGSEYGGTTYKIDIREELIPDNLESFVCIGLNTGAILFLDLHNSLEVVLSFQSSHGIIKELKYRKKVSQLLMFGKDYTAVQSMIRIYQLPDLELLYSVNELVNISCFSISLKLEYFALGCTTGVIHLFRMIKDGKKRLDHHPSQHPDSVSNSNSSSSSNHNNHRTVQEIIRSSENHDAIVTGICFCDDLSVYASCSLDNTVNFWDFEKRLIRSIILNMPSYGLVAIQGKEKKEGEEESDEEEKSKEGAKTGDVIMCQNHYLLTIPRRIWDEGDLLDEAKQQEEYEKAHDNDEDGQREEGQQPNSQNDGQIRAQSKSTKGTPDNSRPASHDAVRPVEDRKKNTNNKKVQDQQVVAPVAGRVSTVLKTAALERTLSGIANSSIENEQGNRPSFQQLQPQPPKRQSAVEKRMSQLSSSRRRFSSLVSNPRRKSLAIAHLPFGSGSAGDNDHAAAADSDDDEDEKDKHKYSEVDEKVLKAVEPSFDKIVHDIKEMFERDVILPHIHDQSYEIIGKSKDKKVTKTVLEDLSSLSAGITKGFISNSFDDIQNSQSQLFQQESTTYYHEVRPPDHTSSVASSKGAFSNSYDTLHPKFLLHKKPPARAMKLEDIDSKLNEYKSKLKGRNDEILAAAAADVSSLRYDYSAHRVHSRRFAQFGLSPRAQLTLLNSRPAETEAGEEEDGNHLQDQLSSLPHFSPNSSTIPHNSDCSTSASRGSRRKSLIPNREILNETDKAIETNLESKLQEQLVVGLGLGMKVSSQYKQQRMTLKRNDAFSSLDQKLKNLSSSSASGKTADKKEKDYDPFYQNILNRNSKKLANPRGGMIGRDQIFESFREDDDKQGGIEDQSIIEVEVEIELSLKGNNVIASNDVGRSLEEHFVEDDMDDSGSGTPSGNAPTYSRRKPLLPVSFHVKDVK